MTDVKPIRSVSPPALPVSHCWLSSAVVPVLAGYALCSNIQAAHACVFAFQLQYLDRGAVFLSVLVKN